MMLGRLPPAPARARR